MKHVQKFTVAMLALAVIGCGGTGGGSSSGSGSSTGTNKLTSTPRIECIVEIQETNLKDPVGFEKQYPNWNNLLDPTNPLLDPSNYTVRNNDLIDPTVFGAQDPLNIEEGEEMIFQLVTYTTDASGKFISRNIIPGTTFTSSDTSGNFGILASNTGQFLAGSSPSPSTAALYVSTIYNGVNYSAQYAIKIRQVRLLGNVLDDSTQAPLAGSLVQFFNAQNQLVDTVTIQFDGTIRASVPTNTTAFTVVGDSLPSSYYHSFKYNNLQYDASVISCYAPTPSSLVVGTTSLTGPILEIPRTETLQISTGCSDPQIKKH